MRLVIAILCMTAWHSAFAHPVAQGQLEIIVTDDAIHIHARVSSEQIFVANTFAPSKDSPPQTLQEAWTHHGKYFLEHLRVFADNGRVLGTISAGRAAEGELIGYDLVFPLASAPRTVRLEEDVLNEIEYAPGNPWEATYVVGIQHGDARQQGLLLTRAQPLGLALRDLAPGTRVVDQGHLARQFIVHGIEHILGGYDHLLFIAALVLATVTFWDLLLVVAAFTLAHTVTLTLSVLNIVSVPAHIVEPMIAASIVFVSLSNIFWPQHSRGRVRLATAFFFGLFHGLGFAGGLLDAMQGMTGLAIGIAIAAFSLGVEIGHQLVVLPLFGALKVIRTRASPDQRDRVSFGLLRAGSAVITAAGAFYLYLALAATIGMH
jgi:hypothetical protein